MRLSSSLSLVLAALALAGCNANSGAGSLSSVAVSKETTSAVAKRSGPLPAADVGTIIVKDQTRREVLAFANKMPQPTVFETMTTETMATGALTNDAMIVPEERPETLIVPTEPTLGGVPLKRSQIFTRQFRDAKPINFGASSPRTLAVHGVDISRWQGEIDWEKLRTQGANFTYIKATDGGDHLDPMFRKNWKRAKDAGIQRGAYHFFYWCRTAGEQADWFIRNVPRDPDALPPVIDVEYNGQSSCKVRLPRTKVLEKMQVFMDKLERHYGKRPVIYTAPDFYRDNLTGQFKDYPFWLRSVAAHPSTVYPGRKWLFWQYSGSGLSHGVTGRIDLNVFHGNEADWHNWVASR